MKGMCAALVAMALGCALPSTAQPMDFMVMVDAYGQAHRNLLGDQILANATRQTIRNQQGGAASPRTAWPDGIDERSIAQRVLTIEELHAMRYSDLQRMRRLLDGREITVQGEARLHPRAPRSFDIAIPGAHGYRVWAYWKKSPPRMPQPGDIVRLRGRAEMERPNSLKLYSPQILPPVATARLAPAAAPKPVAAAEPPTLRFTPSAAVTRETNERIVQTLSPSMAQGRSPDELRRVLDDGELQRGFRQIIGKYGFSDRDLADVMAGHLVLSWQVVNDLPELDKPRGNAVVRDGLREALLGADWMQGVDDARKQALAETLVIGTMLNVSRYVAGKQAGNAQLVSAARQDADAMVRNMAGIDLGQLKFGPRGFEGR